MILLLLSTALILGIVLAYLLWIREFDHWDKKGVPQVKPSFPYGNLKSIFKKQDSVKDFTEKLAKKFPGEPLIGFYGFFQPMLLVMDPELIKCVLVHDFNKYVDNAFRLGPSDRLLNKISFWIPGHQPWKEARSRFTPSMTPAKQKSMVPVMVESFDRYLNLSKQMTVQEAVTYSLLDSILKITFSIEIDLLEAAKNKNSDLGILAQGFLQHDTHLVICASFFAPWMHKFLELRLSPKESDAFYSKFINACVEERKKSQTTKNDILQAIVNIEKKALDAGEPGFTDEEWAGTMMTMLLDTTGTLAMVFDLVLHQLALNPSEQDKLRKEIALGGSALKDFDYDKIANAKRLEMVIYECMRLDSPVLILGRVTEETTKLGNVVVEKGTPVFIAPTYFHMNPKYHQDPTTFRPERFEDPKILNNMTFLPFGLGPKACLGQRYAMNYLKILLIGVLLRYRIVKAADYKLPQVDPSSPVVLKYLENPKIAIEPLQDF